MKPAAVVLVLLALAGSLTLTAASQYFASTAAGYVPPVDNPIALKQYLPGTGSLAYDTKGNLYYATSQQVWRLNADGSDTLIAGSVSPGTTTQVNGAATAAQFSRITAITIDAQQNVYIADDNIGQGAVWKVTPDGQISAAVSGIASGPVAIAVDSAGNLYVLDVFFAVTDDSSRLTQYAPDGTSNQLAILPHFFSSAYMTIAGRDVLVVTGQPSAIQEIDPLSPIPAALVATPVGPLAAGPDGSVYFAGTNTILRFMLGGAASPAVFAGTGQATSAGDGGPAAQAALSAAALAVNPVNGDVALWDGNGYGIRVISAATGKIQTVVGASHSTGDNGPAVLAQLQLPSGSSGLASDPSGNIYFYDQVAAQIRKISPSGIVTAYAGTGVPGNSGDGGKALGAEIWLSSPMVSDQQGNIYFLNNGTAQTIRKIDTKGMISTIAGGGSAPVTAGTAASSVGLQLGAMLAADSTGDVYFTYFTTGSFEAIYKINSSGIISLVAGGGNTYPYPDGTPATAANLTDLTTMAIDSRGVVYFGDVSGLLRTIDPQGLLQTVAGNGDSSFGGGTISAGLAKNVQIGIAEQLIIDSAGDLIFYADDLSSGPQIVKVDPSGNLTIVGGSKPASDVANSSGDGGDADQATFTSIGGLTIDPAGNIYAADGSGLIRELAPYDPANPPPFISTGGVIGAGGSFPAVAAASGGGLVSIFGSNFVTAANQHTLSPADLVNGSVPTQLAGVCVSFAGAPAAMFGVYPSQLNVQAPPGVAPGPVTVQVTSNCGAAGALPGNFGAVLMQAASPEFFSFLPDPVAGNNPIAAVNAVTFVRVGTPGLLPGLTFTPAKGGDIVEAYGTGWGPTNPALGLGVIPGAAANLATPYTLTLGGAPVPASNVFYAGAAPCCAGLDQIDFTVPMGTPSGNQPLVITVGGVPSPPHAFIAVQ